MIMPDQSEEFRQQLLGVEKVSLPLREAYQKELSTMLDPPLTARAGTIGIVLLAMLLACVILIVRADFIYHVGSFWLVGHVALAAAFLWCSGLIVRDLRKRRQSPKSTSAIANALTFAAAIITVAALMRGLRTPSDPKSLFSAFYVFVFYFACAIWSLERRIATAELSAREQSLRIECRLADLADRLTH
jgi:hypothetical protein